MRLISSASAHSRPSLGLLMVGVLALSPVAAAGASAGPAAISNLRRCGEQQTSSYYGARAVVARGLSCPRARRVAGAAAAAVAAAVPPTYHAVRFTASGTRWSCTYASTGSDVPFRVRCRHRALLVAFTASPKE